MNDFAYVFALTYLMWFLIALVLMALKSDMEDDLRTVCSIGIYYSLSVRFKSIISLINV